MNKMTRDTEVGMSPIGLVALFGVVAFLYLASPVVIPIALALYLNLLLSPLVALLGKARLPRPLSAGFIVLGVISLVFAGISLLADPAQEWFEKVPKSYSSVQEKLNPVTEPLEDFSELAETVDDLTTISTEEGDVQRVTVQAPNLFSQIADQLPEFLLSVAIVLFLTYFFLASNQSFLRKIVGLGNSFSERKKILAVFRNIQFEVSNYVLTVTVINLGLGGCVAVGMHALGVPNPLLWGSLATLLNFIPYIGALLMIAVLGLVGLTTFDTPAAIAAPALVYGSLSVIEGNLVTPTLVGKRLSLQPSVVFISLIFWGWMWGIVGAALSIPIMVALKVLLERFPKYRYLSVMLQR